MELVNLGAPQIYTTNYDDLIERCLRGLGELVEVVALPKDVATSMGKKTQVVKYHADLRYEATLVLTESSYYARLDFESPMDLKFRSDLLGRSVLFMGYSFGDINIRIIWFKLMRLMKDIPPADRPSSYIVRFEPNPVLELLYEDVGIKTIVLDPERSAKTQAARTRLLTEFLHELATSAAGHGRIPGHESPLFVSEFLIDKIPQDLKRFKEPYLPRVFAESINRAAQRRIPQELVRAYEGMLALVVGEMERRIVEYSGALAVAYVAQYGPSQCVTEVIVLTLNNGRERKVIFDAIGRSGVSWTALWGASIREEVAQWALEKFKMEIEWQKSEAGRDHDLAYCVDIAYRIKNGYLMDKLS